MLDAIAGGRRIRRSRGMQLDSVLVAAKSAQEASEGSSHLVMASAAISSFWFHVAFAETKGREMHVQTTLLSGTAVAVVLRAMFWC